MQKQNEKGISYVHYKSVPVEYIEYDGKNIREVGRFLSEHGVPHGDQRVPNDVGDDFLCVVDVYRDCVDESHNRGDVMVIFQDKKVLAYTPSEFEANFKEVES